jgi:hypothetical protein
MLKFKSSLTAGALAAIGASVCFDPGKATPAALVKATTDAGYPSRLRE